jgi:hypothetical protein
LQELFAEMRAPKGKPDNTRRKISDAFSPEITPEMIKAGAEAFLRYSGGAPILVGTEETAAYAIFKAMVDVATPRRHRLAVEN